MEQQNQTKTFDLMKMTREIESRVRRKRAARVVAGAALLGVGMARGRLLGLSMAGMGVHFLVEAVTGKTIAEHLREGLALRQLPHGHHLPKTRQGASLDPVDQASWESFPASDPPAYHPGAV